MDSKSAAQLALNGAARSGDISAMERAIKNGAGMNYLGPGDEQTALNVAVGLPLWQRKRAAAIWWLLDHGADPNESDGGDFAAPPLNRFVDMSSLILRDLDDEKEMQALLISL